MLQNQGKMKKNSKKRKNCDATVGKRYPFATEIEKKKIDWVNICNHGQALTMTERNKNRGMSGNQSALAG